jgi:hypothetical protein
VSALLHDIGVAALALLGMWALCSVLRADINRIQRGRRILRSWRRG